MVHTGIEHEDGACVNLLAGEHKKPPVTDVNPAGIVPFITLDGKMMNESHSVMKFLASTNPDKAGSLYPADDLERKFEIDRALDFNGTEFRPAFVKCIITRFGAAGNGGVMNATQQEAFDQGFTKANNALKNLNDMLGAMDGDFVAGDLSLADFALYCEFRDVDFLKGYFDLTPYPNVTKWAAACENVAGIKEIHGEGSKFATEGLPAVVGMVGKKE